ncbi:hypothetical protein LZ24_00581 [Desulfobotulus alkaliphilus]|uniref:Uncharacterized protein n=1 Tax=Desulfobotulus alkaliphilus TaxID=622671 RepID=A0A562S3T3_9BACT|nr:hypothetical protein [Desulfobotulus alkaliphilus]TWI75534.1 hypothetical protein LZ24_00581 [Desulfobotulus alkaliphilus]
MNIKHCLIPGKGVGGLVFGMLEDQVEALLGEADFKDIIDDGDSGKTRVLYYFDQGLTLYFDEEDAFRFGCFEVESMAFDLFGENIARLPKKKLKNFLQKNNIHEIFEEKDEEQDFFDIDALSATFYFEFDTLISVQMGFFTDEKDQPIWPAEES